MLRPRAGTARPQGPGPFFCLPQIRAPILVFRRPAVRMCSFRSPAAELFFCAQPVLWQIHGEMSVPARPDHDQPMYSRNFFSH